MFLFISQFSPKPHRFFAKNRPFSFFIVFYIQLIIPASFQKIHISRICGFAPWPGQNPFSLGRGAGITLYKRRIAMKTTENYTLITGASTGLGKEFAVESARRGKNLVLVALPGGNLSLLCRDIELTFGVKAVPAECDLTAENALAQLYSEILSNFSIDQLINNAGVGGTAVFEDSSIEYLDRIILLNVRATTILTRLMLPSLRLHSRALIMNIASVAAFGPLPYKTVYPASKAFIYSFTRSLSRELRKTGIRVVVVTPGPIVTNPDVAMRISKHGFLGRMGLLSAGEIARLAINGAENGKDVIVPGFFNRFNRFLIHFSPESLRLSLMDKVLQKELTPGTSY
jgi:short-subunit dehydrogenase